MLRQLSIQNYAIIEEIQVSFSAHLNVITGETGAGKSILMGALSLILGERADSSVLLNRERKCFVEGVFSIEGKDAVRSFLQEHDLEYEEELVVRREISASGKSRAFVNDTPVNLDQLRKLSSSLVDLHQQFDSRDLGEADFQLAVLDALAGNGSLLKDYSGQYQQWILTKKALAGVTAQKLQFNKELDYQQFLFDELEDAAFKENELEDLDAELKLMSHAEGIKTALSKTFFELKGGDKTALHELKSGIHQLQGFSSYHAELPPLIQRLQSAQIELEDIAREMDHINRHIHFDPEKIEQISERIGTGYKLLKKHGLKTTGELINLWKDLGQKLNAVLNIDEEIATKEKEAGKLSESCRQIASVLSTNRKAQVEMLEKKVNQLLKQVGMPNARLQVHVIQGSLQESGMDSVEFLFDANKSGRFEPVHKIASGGELSRLMLAIKSLVAQSIDLPTMIFDEIDTGISGEAAKQVAILLRSLSRSRQVICITHQPQIAGKADDHLLVYKTIHGGSIQTQIKVLNREERVRSIAEMLGGEKPTAAAIENAREMMMNES